MSTTGPQTTPPVTLVRGTASAEELAALVAVLAAAAGGEDTETAPARDVTGGWASREALVRSPLVRGPGTWRRSARPR